MDWTIAGVVLTGLVAVGGAWGVIHKITSDQRNELNDKIAESESRCEKSALQRGIDRDKQSEEMKRDLSLMWETVNGLRSTTVQTIHFDGAMTRLENRIEKGLSDLTLRIDRVLQPGK